MWTSKEKRRINRQHHLVETNEVPHDKRAQCANFVSFGTLFSHPAKSFSSRTTPTEPALPARGRSVRSVGGQACSPPHRNRSDGFTSESAKGKRIFLGTIFSGKKSSSHRASGWLERLEREKRGHLHQHCVLGLTMSAPLGGRSKDARNDPTTGEAANTGVRPQWSRPSAKICRASSQTGANRSRKAFRPHPSFIEWLLVISMLPLACQACLS
ncbi:hypothetical protein V8C26DRAFT_289260 [Trichoderma gracile]